MLRPAVTCPRRRLTRSLVAHCAERTIALLAFEDVKAAPMADLLDIAQRQKTASELNAAILASQDLVRPSFRNWAGLPAAQLGAQTMHVHARAAQCCGCCSRQLCGAQHDVHRRTVVGVVSSMSSISRTAYWVALQEPEPRLPGLLKMLLWAQQRLEERVEFPKCGQPLCNLSNAVSPAAPAAQGGCCSLPAIAPCDRNNSESAHHVHHISNPRRCTDLVSAALSDPGGAAPA